MHDNNQSFTSNHGVINMVKFVYVKIIIKTVNNISTVINLLLIDYPMK